MITLYRGIVKGRQRQLKTEGTGIWFSSSIDVARTYSDTVEVWELNDDLNLSAVQMNCNGKSWNEVNTDAIARKYAAKDVILFKDIVDVGPEWLKRIPDEAKKSKDTVHQALQKYFTANDWVVNNHSCINKLRTINFKETKKMNIFENIYEAAEQQRKAGLQGLNEFYVSPEMRPKAVSAEEFVDRFFDEYCDEAGFVNVDKIISKLNSHHSVFALLRTKEVLEQYPLDKEDVLDFVRTFDGSHHAALEQYVSRFCARHEA